MAVEDESIRLSNAGELLYLILDERIVTPLMKCESFSLKYINSTKEFLRLITFEKTSFQAFFQTFIEHVNVEIVKNLVRTYLYFNPVFISSPKLREKDLYNNIQAILSNTTKVKAVLESIKNDEREDEKREPSKCASHLAEKLQAQRLIEKFFLKGLALLLDIFLKKCSEQQFANQFLNLNGPGSFDGQHRKAPVNIRNRKWFFAKNEIRSDNARNFLCKMKKENSDLQNFIAIMNTISSVGYYLGFDKISLSSGEKKLNEICNIDRISQENFDALTPEYFQDIIEVYERILGRNEEAECLFFLQDLKQERSVDYMFTHNPLDNFFYRY